MPLNNGQERRRKVVMCWPTITCSQIGEVVDTLKSRWIGEGPKVLKFEEAFEKKFGIAPGHAVAVNSGTAALELAYDLIGLTKNDVVLTTPLTCTATNIPLVRRGVSLRFSDISKSDLCVLHSEKDKAKAVVVVNLAGIKAKIPKLNCPIVVDACQSIGVYDANADFTCYSFQAIKHITTGDGGMLVCKKKEDADEAKLRRWFGIDRNKKIANGWQPYKNRKILFDIKYPGYKYHMNDIAAGMGLAALREWDATMNHRMKIVDIYKRGLKGVKGIKIIDGKVNTWWLFGVLVDDRDSFCECLMKNGIETNVMHVRNDVYEIFAPFKTKLPNMDWVDERYVYIPLHNKMSFKDARYVVKTIHQWEAENANQSNKGRKAL